MKTSASSRARVLRPAARSSPSSGAGGAARPVVPVLVLVLVLVLSLLAPAARGGALRPGRAASRHVRKTRLDPLPGEFICFSGGQLCPPSRAGGALVRGQCGVGGLRAWRARREGLRQEPPFFFDTIQRLVEEGGTLVELGGAWDILRLPEFLGARQRGRVISLQPDPAEHSRLREAFASDERVTVVEAGLGVRDELVTLHSAGTASASVFSTNQAGMDSRGLGKATRLKLLSFQSFERDHLRPLGADVRGVLINCEGCEYDLVPAIVKDPKLADTYKTIIVQFHAQYDVGPEGPQKKHCDTVQLLLDSGWCPLFYFGFVWEAWVHPSQCR